MKCVKQIQPFANYNNANVYNIFDDLWTELMDESKYLQISRTCNIREETKNQQQKHAYIFGNQRTKIACGSEKVFSF